MAEPRWSPTRRVAVALLVCAPLVGGCKRALLDGTVKSTRAGSEAVNSLHDYDTAKNLAYAGLGQLEGFHHLAPDNTNALAMLTKSWGGTAFAFIQDDEEEALDRGDEEGARYHALRTRAAFERASFYGKELLGYMGPGFEDARKNAKTLDAWLAEEITSPAAAEDLMWIGYAWIGRVSTSVDVPEVVAELWVGVALVQHSVRLDPTAANATGHIVLGAYHARNGLAELEDAKRHFDEAIGITGGRFLPAQLNLATRYHCMKRDKKAYFDTLHAILDAPDAMPEARLQNVIAKRRARRYLGNDLWQEDCAFEL